MSEGSWYYTMKGERQGPIALEVLQALVEKRRVDEDELVWEHGMENWVPVREVAALRMALASGDSGEPPAIPAASVAKPEKGVEQIYEAPKSKFDMDSLEPAPKKYGGIGRLAFFLIPLIVVVLGGYFIYAMVDVGVTMVVPLVVVVLMFIFAGLLPYLSRLTNLGMSRWNYFWLFVPVMGWWIQYRLFACPAGYHDHKTLDSAGKVLRAIFVGLIVLNVLVVIFGGAAGYREALKQYEVEKIKLEEKGS